MRFFVPNGHSTWHVEIEVGKDGGKAVIDTLTNDECYAKRIVEESKIKDLSDISQITRVSAEMTQHVLAGKVVTVDEAIKAWRVHLMSIGRSTRTAINNSEIVGGWSYDQMLRHTSVAAVSPDDISRWVNMPSDHKLGTRRMWLSALRAFFKFCKSNNWTAFDPSSLVEVNHKALKHEQKEVKHKKVLTDGEVDTILSVARSGRFEPISLSDGFFNSAIILGRDLALRIGDVCNLEWACFDFARMHVVVWTEKGKARVAIPMSDRVIDLAMSMPRTDPTFVFPKERELINNPNRRAILSVAFSRFFNHCGFKGYSFHCLRASYATTMAMAGATINEIASALGHASTDTTKAYISKPGAAKL